MSEATNSEDKRKHLEMIQDVINRMASNSFLFKGWSITIIAAISAFAAKDTNPVLMIIPIVSSLLFWAVDGYYLMLERAFRGLYNEVAKKPVTNIDFKMNVTNRGIELKDWFKTLFRPILVAFYGTVIITLLVLVGILNNFWVEVILHRGT